MPLLFGWLKINATMYLLNDEVMWVFQLLGFYKADSLLILLTHSIIWGVCSLHRNIKIITHFHNAISFQWLSLIVVKTYWSMHNVTCRLRMISSTDVSHILRQLLLKSRKAGTQKEEDVNYFRSSRLLVVRYDTTLARRSPSCSYCLPTPEIFWFSIRHLFLLAFWPQEKKRP